MRNNPIVSCVAAFLSFLLSLAPAILRAESGEVFRVSNVNSDPSDWRGLDEGLVFYKSITHSDRGRSWTIKIGKGGQIYSIKTPELGELIAYQRPKNGLWIDEVFQHVIPMLPQKSKIKANYVVDGDIHQAGYYIKSDLENRLLLMKHSVYSPLFRFRHDPQDRSVSYTTWPQHAHLPRRHAENLVMMNQRIRDLDEGVVEIALEMNKWGGKEYADFNLPWVSFRPSAVPVHILSNYDGTYRAVNQQLRHEKSIPRLNRKLTGGWIAFVSSDSPSAHGIAIVFGKDSRGPEGDASYVRWGDYVSSQLPGIAGTVATVKRNVTLKSGETLDYRYYLIFGTLTEIQAKANRLESQVMLAKRTVAQESAERLPVCLEGGKALGNKCANEAPLFKAYKNFVPSAQPLFLLQNARTGEHMVTNDPYEISFDPTDGTTKYVDFLGWAVPAALAGDKCRHQSLSEGVEQMPRQPRFGKKTLELHVLRPTEAACGASGAGGRK